MLETLIAIVILCGAAAEIFAVPRGAGTRPVGLLVASCVAATMFAALLLLSGRPVFSAASTLLAMVTVVAVSCAKARALQEPLVFADFAMLEQVAKRPRLFVPYLGILPAAVIAGSVILATGLAVGLETPLRLLPGGWPVRLLVGAVAGLAAYAGFRLAKRRMIGWGWRLRPSLDPRTDIARFGLFGSLLLGALLSQDRTGKDVVRQRRRQRPVAGRAGSMSDIVAVQLESFFDVRRIAPRIDPGLLGRFDACAAEAAFRGRLTVPGWGGYTQRSEFAFLSGLVAHELGTDRFNPYLQFAKRPVWSIAHELREIGYRTICIHPYHGGFFDRSDVLPNLGFDLFLDIAAFRGAPAFGPYISDLAVAEKVAEVLGEPGRPKFVFAITMENHGQWRKERLPAREIERVASLAPGFPPEFLAYLRHLWNADAMIGRLADVLRTRGGTLCVFGDHLPSFPRLFERAGFDDRRSDYFIWQPDQARRTVVRDIDIATLSELLLEAAKIRPPAPAGSAPDPARQPVAVPSPSVPAAGGAAGEI